MMRIRVAVGSLLASIVFTAIAASAQADDCLAYGSATTLDGWLTLKPATAEQVAGGVAKTKSLWSLKLAKPACVAASGSDAAVASLPRLAVNVPAAEDKAFRDQFGKRVKVSGTIRSTDAAKAGYAVVLDEAKLAQ